MLSNRDYMNPSPYYRMKVKLYDGSTPSDPTSPATAVPEDNTFTKSDLLSPSTSTISRLLALTATKSLITTRGFLSGFTLGFSTAIDAIQIYHLGCIIPALKQTLDEKNPPSPAWLFPKNDIVLGNGQIALWSSFLYLAMLIGGMCSTPITKIIGERVALIVSLWITLIFLVVEAMGTTDFGGLMICQIIVGLALGYRIPIIYSNMSSIFITARSTVFVITSASFIWTIGGMYASYMGWFAIGTVWNMSWRVYLLLCAIPSAILLVMGHLFYYEPVHTGITVKKSIKPALEIMKMTSGKIDPLRAQALIDAHNQKGADAANDVNSFVATAQAFDKSYGSTGSNANINASPAFNPQSEDDLVWQVDVSNIDQISVFYHYLAQYWDTFPASLDKSLDIATQNPNRSSFGGEGDDGNEKPQVEAPRGDSSCSGSPLLSDPPYNQYTPTPIITLEKGDFHTNIELNQNRENQNEQLSLNTEASIVAESPSPSPATASNYASERWLLLVLLCIAWFIVTFASSGFSSFLPTLWNALIPESKRVNNPDISYIISAVYSTVQVPAGFINIIAMSKWFPPKVLLAGAIIQAVATICLTCFYLSSVYAAMAFVFLTQFGSSTVFCAVNYVGVAYFEDQDKVMMYAIQVSVSKLGAFIAQYAFAFLAEQSPRVLLIIVSILTTLVVVACWWLMVKIAQRTKVA